MMQRIGVVTLAALVVSAGVADGSTVRGTVRLNSVTTRAFPDGTSEVVGRQLSRRYTIKARAGRVTSVTWRSAGAVVPQFTSVIIEDGTIRRRTTTQSGTFASVTRLFPAGASYRAVSTTRSSVERTTVETQQAVSGGPVVELPVRVVTDAQNSQSDTGGRLKLNGRRTGALAMQTSSSRIDENPDSIIGTTTRESETLKVSGGKRPRLSVRGLAVTAHRWADGVTTTEVLNSGRGKGAGKLVLGR